MNPQTKIEDKKLQTKVNGYFSGSILLLLAWAGYSRVRNIRYLKREYGQEKDQDESKGLLNQ